MPPMQLTGREKATLAAWMSVRGECCHWVQIVVPMTDHQLVVTYLLISLIADASATRPKGKETQWDHSNVPSQNLDTPGFREYDDDRNS
jgi:hypothetical protein